MAEYLTLTLQGDAYSMGRQHGEQVRGFRPQIAAAIDKRSRQVEEDGLDERFERLLGETRRLIEERDAPLLAMIRGQAEALEFDFEALLRYDLIGYLRDDLLIRRNGAAGGEGCTTWAAAGSCTADGRPILAKNRDYDPAHLPLQVVVRAAPERGYRSLYISSAGSPGVFCAGINEAGLAVADTHVYCSDLGAGLPDYALMMHLLEEHDGVPAALDALRRAPRLGRNNLILADAQGRLAVFECGHRHYGLFEADGGALVNTNHLVSAEMLRFAVNVDPPAERGSTFRRYGAAAAALREAWGEVGVPFARRLMAHHDGPSASICRHREDGDGSATISTGIFLPAERKLLFCQGLPCQGSYDEFAFGTW